LVFDYNNGHFNMSDSKMEKVWADKIFGTGTMDADTASIDDYYKELSGGKFYFKPITVGDNKSGVYTFHLNKDYSDVQGTNPGWPFHDFSYDVAVAVKSLADQGLDLSQFVDEGIDNSNFADTLIRMWDTPQSGRNPQWYSTSKIMAVFPTYNTAQCDFYPLTPAIDSFTFVAHINQDSSFGVIAHELMHTLGAIDVYRFGSYGSDLMSTVTNTVPLPYNLVHVNPFYKMIFDWAQPTIVTESSEVRLYPATSDKYNPVIVRTEDGSQYHILEYRPADGFDTGLTASGAEGLNVWGIDKVGCESIYNDTRKGIRLEASLQPNESVELQRYPSDIDLRLSPSGITVTFLSSNDDGSITAKIQYP